jgi:hypothetical protein
VRLIPWLGWLLVGACGTGQGASYILLDDQSRAARVEVDVDGIAHGGALPLEVEAGGRVEVRGSTARASVAVEARARASSSTPGGPSGGTAGATSCRGATSWSAGRSGWRPASFCR